MPTTDTEETTTAKTYIPNDEKQRWKDRADELDMTLSEFIRTMVQAGQRNFSLDPEQSSQNDATPGSQGIEDRVLETLQTEEALDWDELVSELTESVESELETTLDRLQDENKIKYSGRHGGYTLKTPNQ